jgi:hypothetical protein
MIPATQTNPIWRACLLCTGLGLASLNATPQKVTDIRASASSEYKQYEAAKAVDGKISVTTQVINSALSRRTRRD